MSLLLNGDCLEQMAMVEDNSIDFIFCDLPYGQTSCKWDIIIPWEPFWKEIMRVKKLNTPVFFTTTTKFGVQLINSAPKKMPFRYDLIWVKSAPAGFLSAKKMPMRKHEMIYVFYEKLPFYDLSSHKHKFIKETVNKRNGKDGVDNKGMIKNRSKTEIQNKYTPPLPTSVVKEELAEGQTLGDKGNECYGKFSYYNNGVKGYDPPLPVSVVKQDCYEKNKNDDSLRAGFRDKKYDPPLPVSVVKEDVYNSNERFKNGKLYKNPRHLQKGDDPIYDPPLPTSVVKEDVYGFDNRTDDRPSNVRTNAYDPPLPTSVLKGQTYKGIYSELPQTGKGTDAHSTQYDPPLPTTLLEIKSTRGKHSTEKPVALIEWLLKYYSKEGDIVLDPTMGSGTTGVACKKMNRNFIGIEKDLEIYHVAVDRIED